MIPMVERARKVLVCAQRMPAVAPTAVLKLPRTYVRECKSIPVERLVSEYITESDLQSSGSFIDSVGGSLAFKLNSLKAGRAAHWDLYRGQ